MDTEYFLNKIPEGVVEAVFLPNGNPDPAQEDKIKWSGTFPIPAIGTRVAITINNLGCGPVTGYFYEYNWLGLYVRLDPNTRPGWHKKQNPDRDYAMVFGIEIAVLKE